MTLATLALALNAPACHVASQPTKAPPVHVARYTFPLGMDGKTEVCVEAMRPQIAVGCITLSRLRSWAFDLEAN